METYPCPFCNGTQIEYKDDISNVRKSICNTCHKGTYTCRCPECDQIMPLIKLEGKNGTWKCTLCSSEKTSNENTGYLPAYMCRAPSVKNKLSNRYIIS